jgi:hypothetical protein
VPKQSLVPIDIDGVVVYVEARTDVDPYAEIEVISGGSIERALAGIASIAKKSFVELSSLEWSKLTVELGVEFAVESGGIVAVVGKASSSSSLKVVLEFERSSK